MTNLLIMIIIILKVILKTIYDQLSLKLTVDTNWIHIYIYI